MMTGVGPSEVDAPHEAIDSSFTCNISPAGTLSIGAARFADPAEVRPELLERQLT